MAHIKAGKKDKYKLKYKNYSSQDIIIYLKSFADYIDFTFLMLHNYIFLICIN